MVGLDGTRGPGFYSNPNTFDGLLCQNRAGAIRVEGGRTGPGRLPIGNIITYQCAPGTAVKSLEGWSAAWLDQMRFSCDVLPPSSITVAAAGGIGGTPWTRDCPTGTIGIGLRGNSGDDIDGTTLVCASVLGYNIDGYPTLGAQVNAAATPGGGGSPYGDALMCTGQVLKGLRVRAGEPLFSAIVVDQLGVRCLNSSGNVSDSAMTGLNHSGAAITNVDCPADTFVTGIHGAGGAVMDRIGVECGAPVTPQHSDAVVSSTQPDPAAAGFGQQILINGTNLPSSGGRPQLFVNQGGQTRTGFVMIYTSQNYMARLPTSGLVAGDALLQISAAGTNQPKTAPVAIVISNTPGKPSIVTVTGGAFTAGNTISVSAIGIDTTGAQVRFSAANGIPVTVSATGGFSPGNALGGVRADVVVPDLSGLSGALSVSIRTVVNGVPGPFSEPYFQP